MNLYATITDANYLVRAWALYRSLLPHLDDGLFAFYCVDDTSVEILSRLDPTKTLIVPHADFQLPELKRAYSNRNRSEYCWTTKPFLIRDLFARYPAAQWGMYLDSDMAAFADPKQALDLAGDADVLLTPHRFATPLHAAFETTVGHFNAGLAAFRRTTEGVRALDWWAERCLELCPAVPTPDAYADQKYLNRMPETVKTTHLSPHPGLNAGPWNIEAYRVTPGAVSPLLSGQELLIYHFQGLRIFGTRFFDCYPGNMQLPPDAMDLIYRPYTRRLKDSFAELAGASPGFRAGVQPVRPHWVASQARRLVRGLNNLAFA